MGVTPNVDSSSSSFSLLTSSGSNSNNNSMVASPLHEMPYVAEHLSKNRTSGSIVNIDDPAVASCFFDSPLSSDDESGLDSSCNSSTSSESDHESVDDLVQHLLAASFPPRKSIRKALRATNNDGTPDTKKSVAFGDVITRPYKVVMGDHPCCTMGCALTLSWEYAESTIVSLNDYEAARCPRRTRDALRTTWDERRTMLSDVSDGEVKVAARKLHRERSCQRKNRTRTCAAFFAQDLSEDARKTPSTSAAGRF